MKGGLRAWVFAWQMRCYRELGGLREQPKFEGARMIAIARRILLEAGAELVAKGALDAAEDVMCLGYDDLIAFEEGRAGDLRVKAAEARAEYDREMTRRAVPRCAPAGRGPRAVGDAATAAVVGGIVSIVVLDGVFAVLFFRLGL